MQNQLLQKMQQLKLKANVKLSRTPNSFIKDKDLVCAKFAHTADDRKVYQVRFYNLDVLWNLNFKVSPRSLMHVLCAVAQNTCMRDLSQ